MRYGGIRWKGILAGRILFLLKRGFGESMLTIFLLTHPAHGKTSVFRYQTAGSFFKVSVPARNDRGVGLQGLVAFTGAPHPESFGQSLTQAAPPAPGLDAEWKNLWLREKVPGARVEASSLFGESAGECICVCLELLTIAFFPLPLNILTYTDIFDTLISA